MKLTLPSGPQARKQIVALLILAVILTVVLKYQWSSQAGSALPASNQPGVAAKGAPVGPGALPQPLKLPALTDATDPPAAGRDLFRFGTLPPPPRPATPPPAPAPVGPPPPPPGPPAPPRIELKFYTIIDLQTTGMGRWAGLTDGRGVMFGREGDVIDGRYRVVKINLDSIDMEYLDGRGRQRIPYSGK